MEELGPILAALATGIPVALGIVRYAFAREGPVWAAVELLGDGIRELREVRLELRALTRSVEELAERFPARSGLEGLEPDPDTDEGRRGAPRRSTGHPERREDPLSILARPSEEELERRPPRRA